MDDTDLIAESITKGLAYTENGGKPDLNNPVKGKTGELKSIYQFTPATWKLYAKSELGDENAPLNADNETYVVNNKVKKWVKQGMTARQIASMWNAGEKNKDAYTGKFYHGGPSVGINKQYGVKYDVPGYANKVLKYSEQFYNEKKNNNKPMENNQINDQHQQAFNNLKSIIKEATVKTSPPVEVAKSGQMMGAVSSQV